MNNKGFLFTESLMGLFLIGIIAVSCLPILNTALGNIKKTKDKMNMLLIAESTIEQIKSFDYNWTDEEYIFDMNIEELIEIFIVSEAIAIRLPFNNNQEYDYQCIIYKENSSKDLWKIQVEVASCQGNKRIKTVDLLTFVPIPKKR